MYGRGGPRGPPRQGALKFAGTRSQAGSWNVPQRLGTKKAPEGLVMLAANGDNIISWTNTFASVCEMKYGTIASFIRSKAYPIREILTKEVLLVKFPGLDDQTASKMLIENMTNIMKQEEIK